MTVRFPAELPYDASNYLLEVYAAIVAGDWAEAKRRYDANPQPVGDAAGAIRWWREKFNNGTAPILLSPPLLQPPRTDWAPRAAGQPYAYQAAVDGKILCVCGSGGDPCWSRVSDAPASFPFPDDGHTSYGAGSTGWLPIKAGQWFTFLHTSGNGPQSMRLDYL